jgi:hypothetical protein
MHCALQSPPVFKTLIQLLALGLYLRNLFRHVGNVVLESIDDLVYLAQNPER